MRILFMGILAPASALRALVGPIRYLHSAAMTQPGFLCAEPVQRSIGYNGEYTGHDEPARGFLFQTKRSGKLR